MSSSNSRTNYNNNVKKTSKKCFITAVTSPQAENAHILPLNTCLEIGYKIEAEDGNNHLHLSKNLHATFELENNIPTWTLERISEIGERYTTYRLKILDKPYFLEEQLYKNKIFEIDSYKVPYLEIHYGLCCHIYGIKTHDNFKLYNLMDEKFRFLNIFQKYVKYIDKSSRKRTSETEEIKKPIIFKKLKNKTGCVDKDDQQYLVKKILKHKYDRINEINIYLIEWDGKDQRGKKWKNSWEPAENINSDVIQEYLNS